MENSNNKGWNAGAHPTNQPNQPNQPNPAREPNLPMTQSTETDYKRSQYNQSVQQSENINIRPSDEQRSGNTESETTESSSRWKDMLHKFASKLSDSQYAFWLPLLFANRAKVAEGISDVLQKGSISNLLEETGLKHEWEHNRKSLVTKVAVSTAVAAGVFALVRWNNHRKQNQV